MLECRWIDLGRVDYAAALDLQRQLVAERQRGTIPDTLLLLDHPHVITLGRNGRLENLLAGEEHLRRAGVEFYPTDRGGDITYHGPGQLVGYPILDLRQWKRDVVAYLRALEQVLIDALGEFAIAAGRAEGMTGVWTGGAKIAAMGVHISRWVTSHGFALNVSTDLSYFDYIVPCGLPGKPVTSMERLLGRAPAREQVIAAVASQFGCVFERQMIWS
ncbi:MAG: lipoyl(octanoyl) transferase LipB, partial [Acidobacteria bacterium]|nr:lipoyl(octanoyl) transferase LipB [Acidobacteriota bacterium]